MVGRKYSMRITLHLGAALALLLPLVVNGKGIVSNELSNKVIISKTLGENQPGPFLAPNIACADGSCDVSSVRPDVILLKVCEYEIRTYCLHRSIYKVLSCLIETSANVDKYMCPACIKETQIQQWMLSKDFLNGPQSHPSCDLDIQRLCLAQDREGNSARRARLVTKCLEKHFSRQELSGNCASYMMVYMREGSLDYLKPTPFTFECATEIQRHCRYALPKSAHDQRDGQVVECLKLKFLAHFISDILCSEEIVTSLQASHLEPRTDPLFYMACYRDINMHCGDVIQINGQQVRCLERKVDTGVMMELQCLHMVRRRIAMWKFGAMVSPASFPNYVVQRSASHFFYTYTKYIVVMGAFLLSFICSLVVVLIISKRRQIRMRRNVHYIKIAESK